MCLGNLGLPVNQGFPCIVLKKFSGALEFSGAVTVVQNFLVIRFLCQGLLQGMHEVAHASGQRTRMTQDFENLLGGLGHFQQLFIFIDRLRIPIQQGPELAQTFSIGLRPFTLMGSPEETGLPFRNAGLWNFMHHQKQFTLTDHTSLVTWPTTELLAQI